MAKIDTYHSTKIFNAFTIYKLGGTQEVYGSEINTFKSESVQFVAQCDQLSTGTYTLTIQEYKNGTWINVDSNFVLNSPFTFTNETPYGANHLAYLGNEKLVRIKINSVSASEFASIAVTAMLGENWHEPIEGLESPTG